MKLATVIPASEKMFFNSFFGKGLIKDRFLRRSLLLIFFSFLHCSIFEPNFNPNALANVPVFSYPATSFWNQKIVANPELDPDSALYVKTLVKERVDSTPYAETLNDGVPVYYCDRSTSRYFVPMKNLGDVRRGVKSVPIPTWALPNGGTDSHIVLIDTVKGLSFEFWRFNNQHGVWFCGNAAIFDLNGNGVTPYISARASGFSLLGGVIWPQELLATNISHALSIAVAKIHTKRAAAPATYTDGRSDASDALPMGAHLQLDPALDLSSLDLDPYQKAIFRALQEYGAYVCDTGTLALVFINARSFASDPYVNIPSYNAKTKSFQLDKLPVDKLRVLKLGDLGANHDGYDHQELYE
jgi:hypothetical protein